MNEEYWYRFIDWSTNDGGHHATVGMVRFRVLKHTPAGAWLAEEGYPRFAKDPMSKAMGDPVPPGKAHGDRWCGRYHRRSYAYPTIDLAWHSFRIRKMRQVEHLQRALTRATAVSEAIKDIVKPPVTDRYVDLDGRLLKREEVGRRGFGA